MPTISIISAKGGAGKTTISVLLAMALQHADRSVSVNDLDPQRSATWWLTQLGLAELLGNHGKFVIEDTPPRLDGNIVKASAERASVIIMPTKASPIDVITTQDTVKYLATFGASSKAHVLYNGIRRQTSLAKAFLEDDSTFGVPVLKRYVSQRECIAQSGFGGWAALDSNAKDEIVMVALAILGILSGEESTPASTSPKKKSKPVKVRSS